MSRARVNLISLAVGFSLTLLALDAIVVAVHQ